jgi:hypothetical protein
MFAASQPFMPTHVWIIPGLMAVSFLLILLLGKRFSERVTSGIGICFIGVCFVRRRDPHRGRGDPVGGHRRRGRARRGRRRARGQGRADRLARHLVHHR